MNNIDLGDKVKDIITGYTGIVIGVTNWLNGCRTLGIRSIILKDGLPQDPQWIDENQLKLIIKSKFKLGKTDTGGPQVKPFRMVEPK